jgi:predicted nucleic acid-binding protein
VYLLDTVTISQALSRRANAGALAWIARQQPAALFLSVVTIAEIRRGAVQARKKDTKFADRIDEWLIVTASAFDDRILPINVSIARVWGTLQATAGHGGEDIMIAATALDRGLTVVTQNTRDFMGLGVKVENPFS